MRISSNFCQHSRDARQDEPTSEEGPIPWAAGSTLCSKPLLNKLSIYFQSYKTALKEAKVGLPFLEYCYYIDMYSTEVRQRYIYNLTCFPLVYLWDMCGNGAIRWHSFQIVLNILCIDLRWLQLIKINWRHKLYTESNRNYGNRWKLILLVLKRN